MFLGNESHNVIGPHNIFLSIKGKILELKVFAVARLQVFLLLGMPFISDYKYQLDAGTSSLKLINLESSEVIVTLSGLTVGMFFANRLNNEDGDVSNLKGSENESCPEPSSNKVSYFCQDKVSNQKNLEIKHQNSAVSGVSQKKVAVLIWTRPRMILFIKYFLLCLMK